MRVPTVRRARRGMLVLMLGLATLSGVFGRRVAPPRATSATREVPVAAEVRVDPPPTALREVTSFALHDGGGMAVTRDGALLQWWTAREQRELPRSQWQRAWRVEATGAMRSVHEEVQGSCRGTVPAERVALSTAGALLTQWAPYGHELTAWYPRLPSALWSPLTDPLVEFDTSREVIIARTRSGTLRVRHVCEPSDVYYRSLVTPTPDVRIADAVAVRAGSSLACALSLGGALRCWTFEHFAPEIYDREHDTIVRRHGPTSVEVPPLASLIVLRDKGCGVTHDGAVRCFEALAHGARWRVWTHPWLRDVSQLHSLDGLCATLRDGRVVCDPWFLPRHAGDQRPTPPARREFPALRGAREIRGNEFTGCARFNDGTLRCWGDENLPDGRVLVSTTPLRATAERFRALQAGASHVCGLAEDGRVMCWGGGRHRAPGWMPGVQDAVQLAVGGGHACARLRDGRVMCWSSQTGTETPRASTLAPDAPTRVPDLTGALEVSAGERHACARLAGGRVRCWGLFEGAWPGHPRVHGALRPLEIALPAPAVGVRSVGPYACATLADRRVLCWGGTAAPGDDGETLSRALIEGPWAPYATLVESSTAALDCALTAGRALRCGLSLEDRFETPRRSPHIVMTDAVATASSAWQACAAQNGREVRCVARSLPAGPNERAVVAPVSVTLPRVVRALTAGRGFACALLVDGSAWCWGENREGELGSGTQAAVGIDAPNWVVR